MPKPSSNSKSSLKSKPSPKSKSSPKSESSATHDSSFEAQLKRILAVAKCRTQLELAEFLGIRQSSISDAKRRKNIPSSWLIVLMQAKNVFPEWILTGNDPCIITLPASQGYYETENTYAKQKADEQALKQLSSQTLADELLRRIAVS